MLDEVWDQLITFSEQFIVPDWGALVLLLPVFLAFLVVMYLVWILYRAATAGPTRRGYRRRTPVAPESIHMPGPSFAPLLAGFGVFMLMFGLFAGGLWLWAGVLILVITLLYWGREALRDYDHLPSVATEHAAPISALQRPQRRQRGHPRPRSGRSWFGSLAMLLVGMIMGGWALVLGLMAVVLAGLGWLRDARREYVAVEDADRTGHLDMGGAPAWPKATFAALAIIVGLAVVVSSGILSGSGGDEAAPSGGPAASGDAGGYGRRRFGGPDHWRPRCRGGRGGDRGGSPISKEISVPADGATIAFDNRDAGCPHDIVIKDAAGTTLFQGARTDGPVVVVYDVPALPAGRTFVCSFHEHDGDRHRAVVPPRSADRHAPLRRARRCLPSPSPGGHGVRRCRQARVGGRPPLTGTTLDGSRSTSPPRRWWC
jgi:hypothetical protein